MKPCCQLCWRDVIVDADGHAAWCCNACALKLHAVVEAARLYVTDEPSAGRFDRIVDALDALDALDAAKEGR